MYAVVTTGGKQYRVEAGSELVVERLVADPGSTVTFDRVLMVGDGDDVTVGTPVVDGATVSGTVVGEELGPKLIIFKFKQKVKYRRTNGHRQHLTRVRIDEISAGGKRTRAKAESAPTKAVDAKAADRKAAPAKAAAKPARARTTASGEGSTKRATKKSTADTGDKPAPRRRASPKKGAEE